MTVLDSRRQQLRTLFTAMITAYGCKDFDTFARYVHEDAVFDWPYLPLREFPSEVKGRDRFIDISRDGMASCDGYFHKVQRFYDLVDSDMLIVEYRSDTVLPSGQPYANDYLGILRFDGDLVTYWREYVNPLPIIEAYGLGFSNQAATP